MAANETQREPLVITEENLVAVGFAALTASGADDLIGDVLNYMDVQEIIAGAASEESS